MRRGGKNSHINSLGFRDYSRTKNNLSLYRLKIVGHPCAEGPYIKEWLLKKPKIKGAVGRGCEVMEKQIESEEEKNGLQMEDEEGSTGKSGSKKCQECGGNTTSSKE